MQIGQRLRSMLVDPLENHWEQRRRKTNCTGYGHGWPESSGTRTAPDYVFPRLGYRMWQWDSAKLKSLNCTAWTPNLPLVATCRAASDGQKNVIGKRRSSAIHQAPGSACTCGIYASKSLTYLPRSKQWRYASVYGEVWLWGKVIEHEHGYRSQFAYPSRLFLKLERLPMSLAAVEERIKQLSSFGCDLFLTHKSSAALLWCKAQGVHADGIQLITRRSNDGHVRQRENKMPKLGDRIAMRGGGTAIVEHSGFGEIHARLWPTAHIRISMRDVHWDETNSRWEMNSMQAFSSLNASEIQLTAA